jgi:hypothetical protein
VPGLLDAPVNMLGMHAQDCEGVGAGCMMLRQGFACMSPKDSSCKATHTEVSSNMHKRIMATDFSDIYVKYSQARMKAQCMLQTYQTSSTPVKHDSHGAKFCCLL